MPNIVTYAISIWYIPEATFELISWSVCRKQLSRMGVICHLGTKLHHLWYFSIYFRWQHLHNIYIELMNPAHTSYLSIFAFSSIEILFPLFNLSTFKPNGPHEWAKEEVTFMESVTSFWECFQLNSKNKNKKLNRLKIGQNETNFLLD